MLTRIDLTLDCANPAALAEFWKTAAGYGGMGAAWLHDPTGVAPRLSVLQVPEPKTSKNRLHLDLRVSGDATPEQKWSRVTDEVARLTAAGAVALHTFAGHHVVMTDPEGNEFCIA